MRHFIAAVLAFALLAAPGASAGSFGAWVNATPDPVTAQGSFGAWVNSDPDPITVEGSFGAWVN
ncbi:hypothetical protein GCM10008955_10690 [Deinococcus malanensis]|uniref:Uncharacterized protein n=1 Tax=Deinococcus malanensis TaxID=1706855 RepID=A0ABQ2EPD0_9DEIO|nr:hypothetical protein [Deinococcus malanensis]GGK19146.1 hypothetical protein GCM10008955_10690 [Deinococcus malanensis]